MDVEDKQDFTNFEFEVEVRRDINTATTIHFPLHLTILFTISEVMQRMAQPFNWRTIRQKWEVSENSLVTSHVGARRKWPPLADNIFNENVLCFDKNFTEVCLEGFQFDGLLQKRRNSIANALELRISCTNILNWKCSMIGLGSGLAPNRYWMCVDRGVWYCMYGNHKTTMSYVIGKWFS